MEKLQLNEQTLWAAISNALDGDPERCGGFKSRVAAQSDRLVDAYLVRARRRCDTCGHAGQKSAGNGDYCDSPHKQLQGMVVNKILVAIFSP